MCARGTSESEDTMSEKKIIVNCGKCGQQDKISIAYPNAVACPKCGKHGQIGLSNAAPVYDRKGNLDHWVPDE